MSISSQMSSMSVSYCGSEIPIEQALDECFTELIQYQNHLHCYVRELCMMQEQDNDYIEGLNKVLTIHDTIDQTSDLFKELKSVCSQVLGKPPKEEKEQATKIIDDHKIARKKLKDAQKTAEKLATSHNDTPL